MWKWILLFLLANLVIFAFLFNLPTQKKVVFLDVGQGSSILIQDGKNVFLYDTGRSGYPVLQGLRKHLPFFQKRIDILFLSHSDKDHYGGAFAIFERYRVRYLVTAKNFSESGFQKLLSLARKNGTKILFLTKGDKILSPNLAVEILHPAKNYFAKDNNLSLTLKITGSQNQFLLTGDIEKEAMAQIIQCCQEKLASEIMLWPHHGSKYSLLPSFFQKVKPKTVVIQVGPNYYGHPHQEVLNFLQTLGIPVFRTDLDGEILFPL